MRTFCCVTPAQISAACKLALCPTLYTCPILKFPSSFVCATSEQLALETVKLTSYRNSRYPPDLLKITKVWEAARATSAATTFFAPIQIGPYGERFVDGGSGANNPIREVWTEAADMWKELGPLNDNINCLVSIGTGIPNLEPFGTSMAEVAEALKAISLETEKTAEKFHVEHDVLRSEGRYFRFNVIKGLEKVGLEHSGKRADIAAATRKYISGTHEDMAKCSSNLRDRKCMSTSS